MQKYKICGGHRLHGEVEISGAKNAAVAIIPAALMIDGVCRIENLPQISDTVTLFHILESLGATVRHIDRSTAEIDCRKATWQNADYELTKKIRASYYLVGSMLARFGIARTTMPGGCNFGDRPIDQHVKGFNALGARVDVTDYIDAEATEGRLKGARVNFDKVSVGATMNVMIAAAMAEGHTVIDNAAREPHIVDLANFLNSMGADIRGAGTESIKINGVDRLHGGTYAIIPDQIEAGTYMAAAAAAGGEVLVTNVIPKHLECISSKLREMGVTIEEYPESVLVRSSGRLRAVSIKTQPYPGFPTDMQPQMGVCMSVARGVSKINEGIYDNRFKYFNQLRKMGVIADTDGNKAIVEGVEKLHGATVEACDLRAGAAMAIAGLCAEGTTYVEKVHYIERGYQDFVGKLRALGADISIEGEPDPEDQEI